VVWGLEFGVWGLGFVVWGLGFGVWVVGFETKSAVSSQVVLEWKLFSLTEPLSNSNWEFEETGSTRRSYRES